MTFTPAIPISGLAGWAGFQATRDRQLNAFSQSPEIRRDITRFREKLPEISSVDALMRDRSALNVALGAFDLSADINNTYFIKTVLEQGTAAPEALANRLRDDRYKALAEAFGATSFALGLPGQGNQIASVEDRFVRVAFETKVGEVDPTFRLALGFQRILPEIAESSTSQDAAWFRVLGSKPLRTVFEKVFGLPTDVGKLDVDRQRDIFRDKARDIFGTDDLKDLAAPEVQDTIVRRFLLRSQLDEGTGISGLSVALSLVSQTAAFLKR